MFSKVLLLSGVFIVVLLSRFPGMVVDRQLNPDESVILAGVLTAQSRGFVPWKDFDVTTIGPVTVWFLGGIAWAGLPMTYASLHVVAALLWALTAVLCVVIARLCCGIWGALFVFFLLLLISLLAWRPDYLHFSSEAVPSPLLTAAAALLAVSLSRELNTRAAATVALLSGALCSISVLAKLQSLPIAAFLCAANLLPTLSRNWTFGLAVSLALAFGALLPTSLLALWLWHEDAFLLGLQSYVLGGSSYGASQALGVKWALTLARDILLGWGVFLPAFIVLLLITATLACEGWRPWKCGTRSLYFSLLFAGWFSSAFVALIVPSYRFEHHGVFLVAPAALLITYLVFEWCLSRPPANARAQWLVSIFPKNPSVWMAAVVLLLVGVFSFQTIMEIRRNGHYQHRLRPTVVDRVAHIVDHFSEPGEPVAVWGWAPQINVITGRPSATRHVIGHFLIDDNAARDMHRKTFMADLSESRPKVIVDAVGPGFFTWRWGPNLTPFRAEAFPELSTFLNKNYRLVEPFSHQAANGHVIVYARIADD